MPIGTDPLGDLLGLFETPAQQPIQPQQPQSTGDPLGDLVNLFAPQQPQDATWASDHIEQQNRMPISDHGKAQRDATRRAWVESHPAEAMDGFMPGPEPADPFVRDPQGNIQFDASTKMPVRKQVEAQKLDPFERLYAATLHKQSSTKDDFTGPAGAMYWIRRAGAGGTVVDIADRLAAKSAIDRIVEDQQQGTSKASEADYMLAGRHAAEMNPQDPAGVVRQAFDIASAMPGYVSDFLLTGGASAAGQAATRKLIGKAAATSAGKAVSKALPTIGPKLAQAAEVAGGEFARLNTPVMLGRVEADALGRMTDKPLLTGNKADPFVVVDGDDVATALGKAYAMQYVEQLGERSGAGVASILAPAKNKVVQGLLKVAPKGGELEKLLKLSATGGGDTIMSRVRKAAKFDGIPAEMLEEALTEIGQSPIEGYGGGVVANLIESDITPGALGEAGKQVAAMGLGFGVMPGSGVAGAAGRSVMDARARHDELIQAEQAEERAQAGLKNMGFKSGGQPTKWNDPAVIGKLSESASPEQMEAFAASPSPSRSALANSGLESVLKETGLYDQANNARGRTALWESLRAQTAEQGADMPAQQARRAVELTPDESLGASVSFNQGRPRFTFDKGEDVGDVSIQQQEQGWQLEYPEVGGGTRTEQVPSFNQAMDVVRGPKLASPMNRRNAEIIETHLAKVKAARRAGKVPPVASPEVKAAMEEQGGGAAQVVETAAAPPVENSAPPAATPVPAAEVVVETPAVKWPKQSIASDEPPIPAGHVRMYHGGSAYEGGPRWLSHNRAYAQGYADKSEGAGVSFVDLPSDSPLLSKSFDDTGTPNTLSPPVAFEAPEDVASKLTPIASRPTATVSAAESVPTPTNKGRKKADDKVRDTFKKHFNADLTPPTELTPRQQKMQAMAESFGGVKVLWHEGGDSVPAGMTIDRTIIFNSSRTEDATDEQIGLLIGDEVAHATKADRDGSLAQHIPNAELAQRQSAYYEQSSPERKKFFDENPEWLEREGVASYVAQFWRDKAFRDALEESDKPLWKRIAASILRLFGKKSAYEQLEPQKKSLVDELRGKMKNKRNPATAETPVPPVVNKGRESSAGMDEQAELDRVTELSGREVPANLFHGTKATGNIVSGTGRSLQSQGIWLTNEGKAKEFAEGRHERGEARVVQFSVKPKKVADISNDTAAWVTAEGLRSRGFDMAFIMDTGFWVVLDESIISPPVVNKGKSAPVEQVEKPEAADIVVPRPVKSAADVRKELIATGKVTEEQTDTIMALIAARAASAGKSVDEWVASSLAGIELGGTLGDDTLLQTAYHGSPHRHDKFSTEKIGTGEGNQSYGWGLYFAGNREVAEWYRKTLADVSEDNVPWRVDGKPIYDGASTEDVDLLSMSLETAEGDTVAEKIANLETRKKEADNLPEDVDMYNDMLELLKKYKDRVTRPGALYHVDLKPAEDEYLLWDKPLSEQSEKVKAAITGSPFATKTLLASAVRQNIHGNGKWYIVDKRGEWGTVPYDTKEEAQQASIGGSPQSALELRRIGSDMYTLAASALGSDQAASEMLKSLGIRGIKYLDGSSRGKGHGHYNYVIFDDADVEIVQVFQKSGETVKGSAEFLDDGRAIIRAFESGDFSTLVHELGHLFRRQLPDADMRVAGEWAGATDGKWGVPAEEKFARGFERYLRDGSAPTAQLKSIFAKFKQWLKDIYKNLVGSDIDIELSDEIRGVFDRMLSTPETAVKRGSPGEGAEVVRPGKPASDIGKGLADLAVEALQWSNEEDEADAATAELKTLGITVKRSKEGWVVSGITTAHRDELKEYDGKKVPKQPATYQFKRNPVEQLKKWAAQEKENERAAGAGQRAAGTGSVGRDQPPLSERGQAGSDSGVVTADGKTRKVQYVAVESDDVIPSHDARKAFTRNEQGDDNERPYHDTKQGAASRQIVQEISAIDPEKVKMLVSDTPTASDGPPITDDMGVVLGGNARSMGMQLAYYNGGEAAERLKRAMVLAAGKFGIDARAVENMKQPIIVRVLDEPGERGELSALLNESMAAAKSQATIAVSQGKRVSPETAAKISAMLEPQGGEDVPSLRDVLGSPARSEQIVQAFQKDGVWSEREIGLYVDPTTGVLNADGKAAVESLLIGRLIADPSIVGDASPAVKQTLIAAIGPLVRGMSDAKHGERFTQVIKDAVQAFAGYKAEELPLEAYFMKQKPLFPVPGLGDYSVAGMVHAMDAMGPLKFKKVMDNVVRSLGIKSGKPTKSMFAEMDVTVDTMEQAVEQEIQPPLKSVASKEGPEQESVNKGRKKKPDSGDSNVQRGKSAGPADNQTTTTTTRTPLQRQVPATWASDALETASGKELAAKQQVDMRPDNPVKRIGIRHIMKNFADHLGAALYYTSSQLAGVGGKYLKRESTIFTRSPFGVGIMFHELGHALENLLKNGSRLTKGADRTKYNRYRAEIDEKLTELTASKTAPGGVVLASSENAQEGFAEFVRRYIHDHQSLDGPGWNEVRRQVEEMLRDFAPDALKAMRDAHRLVVVHERRSQDDQNILVQTEHLAAPESEAKLFPLLNRLGTAFIGPLVHLDSKRRALFRGVKRRSGGDHEAVLDARAVVEEMFDREGSGPHREFSWALGQTGVTTEVQTALNNAIRAYSFRDSPFFVLPDDPETWTTEQARRYNNSGGLTESQAARLTELGITLPTKDAASEELIYLTPLGENALGKMMVDLKKTNKEPLFDAWRAFKVALYRHQEATKKDNEWRVSQGLPAIDWRDDIAAIVSRHKYPGIEDTAKPGEIEAWVAKTSAENPEFEGHFKTQEKYLRQLLLLDFMSGERTADDLIRMLEKHRIYSHLPRQMLMEGVGSGGGSNVEDPSSGIKRAHGSQLPFLPLRVALQRRTQAAVTAYYQNAARKATVEFGKRLEKPFHRRDSSGRMREIAVDYFVRKDLQGMAVPVVMDKTLAATVSPAEMRTFAEQLVKAIQDQHGIDVNVDDLEIDGMGSVKAFRHVKPRLPNVVSYFDIQDPGKRKYLFVPEPAQYAMMTYLGAQSVSNFAKVGRVSGRLFAVPRKILTHTIGFMIRNAIRDPKSSSMWADTKHAKSIKEFVQKNQESIPFALHFAYLRHVADTKYLGDFAKGDMKHLNVDGEILSRVLTPEFDESDDTFLSRYKAHVLGEWNAWDAEQPLADRVLNMFVNAQVVAASPITALTGLIAATPTFGGMPISEFTETAPRRGAMALKKLAGGSDLQASLAFSMSTGFWAHKPSNRTARDLYAGGKFLNPAVQAQYQTARIFLEMAADHGKLSLYMGKLGMRLAQGSLEAVVAAATAMLFAGGDDDEERQAAYDRLMREKGERPGEDLMRRGWFVLPGGVSMMLPFGEGPGGAIEAMGFNLTMAMITGQPRSVGLGSILMKMLTESPVGNPASLLPTGYDSAMELLTGTNFFTGQKIEDPWLKEQFPNNPEMWHTDRDPQMYVMLNEGLRKLGLPEFLRPSAQKTRFITEEFLTPEFTSAVKTIGHFLGYDKDYKLPLVGGITASNYIGRGRSARAVGDLAREARSTQSTLAGKAVQNQKSPSWMNDTEDYHRRLWEIGGSIVADDLIKEKYDAMRDERARPDSNEKLVRQLHDDMTKIAVNYLKDPEPFNNKFILDMTIRMQKAANAQARPNSSQDRKEEVAKQKARAADWRKNLPKRYIKK